MYQARGHTAITRPPITGTSSMATEGCSARARRNIANARGRQRNRVPDWQLGVDELDDVAHDHREAKSLADVRVIGLRRRIALDDRRRARLRWHEEEHA